MTDATTVLSGQPEQAEESGDRPLERHQWFMAQRVTSDDGTERKTAVQQKRQYRTLGIL